MADKLYYLAYGSNLHPLRLQKRVPSATPVGVTQLKGYSLHFHAEGMDYSGKCNIVKSQDPKAVVYAFIYAMDADDQEALDRHEGPAYGIEAVTAEVDEKKYECLAFIAIDQHIDEQLEPYDWYKELVVQGALYHQFPDSYIQAIQGVACKEDTHEQRVLDNEQLIKELRNYNRQTVGERDEGSVTLDMLRDYCRRIEDVLVTEFGETQGDLEEKLQNTAKYLDQYFIDQLNHLSIYQKQSEKGQARIGMTADEFAKTYNDVLDYLSRRAEQIQPPPKRLELSPLTHKFGDFVGLMAGISAMFAIIVGGTYYGYKTFDYGGAFFAFLLVFVISGILIRPVRFIFRFLGLVVAGTMEKAFRHYAVSSVVLALVMVSAFVYWKMWGVPQFMQNWSVLASL